MSSARTCSRVLSAGTNFRSILADCGAGRAASEGRTAGNRALRRALRGALRRAGAVIDAAPLPMSSSEMRSLLVCRQGADVLDGEGLCAHHPPARLTVQSLSLTGCANGLCLPETQTHPHVAGCEQEAAASLALRWGEDPGDAAEAGILHDITKKLSMDEQLILAEKYGIVFDKFERENIKLTHAITGAAARGAFRRPGTEFTAPSAGTQRDALT